MLRKQCPKCSTVIECDETQHQSGETVTMTCPLCGEQILFAIPAKAVAEPAQEEPSVFVDNEYSTEETEATAPETKVEISPTPVSPSVPTPVSATIAPSISEPKMVQNVGNGSQSYENIDTSTDKVSIGLDIVSLLVPIVGIVLYFVFKSSSPKKGKSCLKAAIAGCICSFIFQFIVGFMSAL